MSVVVRDLNIAYAAAREDATPPILPKVNLAFGGEFAVLVDRSGCGKSTLVLYLIAATPYSSILRG